MKVLILSSILILGSAFAGGKINFHGHKGTGCPQGTLSVVPSPDQKSLSLLFDEFYAEIPQYNGNNDNDDEKLRASKTVPYINNKVCFLNFSSLLENDHKVDSIEISLDSRGATSLDQGVSGQFVTVLESYRGLANSRDTRGQMVGRKLWGLGNESTDEDWTISNTVSIPINSRCASSGESEVHFRVKNTMRLRSLNHSENDAGFIALDTTDITNALKIKIQVSKCNHVSRPSRPQPPGRNVSRNPRNQRPSRKVPPRRPRRY